MIKRISAILMAVCMIACCFTGCGDDKNKGGKQANVDTAYFDNIPVELVGSTVRFASWRDHTADECASVIEGFIDLTGIDVEMELYPEGQYVAKLQAQIAADDAPDVIIENGTIATLLQVLQPIENAGIDPKDKFWDQNAIPYYTFGGKTYAVNGANSYNRLASSIITYNVEFFETYGIKTPDEYIKENNWTWETFKQCMKDIRNAPADGDNNNTSLDVKQFLNAYGAQWIGYNTETGKYENISTNTNLFDCYKYILEISESNLAYTPSGMTTSGIPDGTGVMCLTAAFALRKNGWYKNVDPATVAYTKLPKRNASDENYPGTYIASRAYGLCEGSKNPLAAGYFIRYFLDDNNYNMDEVYLNESSAKLAKDQLKNGDFSIYMCEGTVYKVLYSGGMPQVFMNPVVKGSSSQITTNIATVSGTLDNCIKEANAIIDKTIEEYK